MDEVVVSNCNSGEAEYTDNASRIGPILVSIGDDGDIEEEKTTPCHNNLQGRENSDGTAHGILQIKTEPTENEEEDNDAADEIAFSPIEGGDILPLDVQIVTTEVGISPENGDECEEIEELPVKTELAESEEEIQLSGVNDENTTNTYIKVEPLEESYEDRINDFIRAVGTEKHTEHTGSSDTNNSDPGSDNEAENGHFLSQVKQKRKSKSKRSLQCSKCSTRFKYQSTYDYHVKSACGTKMIAKTNQLIKANKNQSFVCNVCQKELCSRTSLMVHMRIHNGERPFVCDICNRSFFQKAHLTDHKKTHLSGKPGKPLVFTCSECGDVFPEKKFLTSHMSVHFGDKVFDCNVCHKRFRTRSNLSNHKIIHSEKKEHQCNICGKEFLRKPSLDDHMRIHTKEKPFECGICGKRFAEKNRRNTHVKRHTGELNQECPTCGRKFACSYDLRIHQRMHTGEKPFSCNICGRMFNRKAIMETHMTIHTGRKDFVCTQCGEAFNRKSKLDVHLTSHTGEKFCCEICHRVFKCKAYLVPHVRTHFGEGRQRGKTCHCLLCRKQFTNNKQLQEHLLQAHPSLFKPPPIESPAIPPITFVKVESDQ